MNTKRTAPKPAAFYKAERYEADESVGLLMRRIISLLAQQIEHEFEPSGLTHAQWLPLWLLSRGSAVTGAELARCCELDAGAMTRLLDRLETKGLCQRERSLQDRRVVNLHLTPEGKEAARVVPQVLSHVQNSALAGFTREEWQTLRGLLRRMLDNVQAMQAEGEHDEN